MLAKVRKDNNWTLFEKRYYSNFSMFKINIYHCVKKRTMVKYMYMLITLIQDLLVKIRMFSIIFFVKLLYK